MTMRIRESFKQALEWMTTRIRKWSKQGWKKMIKRKWALPIWANGIFGVLWLISLFCFTSAQDFLSWALVFISVTNIMIIIPFFIVLKIMPIIEGSNPEKIRKEAKTKLTLLNNAIKETWPIYPAIFLASVFYNWIYFKALSIRLADTPLSFADYVLTPIIWMLPSVVPAFVYFIINPSVIVLLGSIFTLPKPARKISKCIGFAIAFTYSMIVFYVLLCYYWNYFGIQTSNFFIDSFEAISPPFGIIALVFWVLFRDQLQNLADKIADKTSSTKDPRPLYTMYKLVCFTMIPVFLSFLILPFSLAPKIVQISAMCPEEKAQQTFIVSDKPVKGVFIRSFESYFLIRDCKSEELKFIKLESFTNPNWKKREKPAKQEPNQTQSSPTPPAALQPPQPGAEQQ